MANLKKSRKKSITIPIPPPEPKQKRIGQGVITYYDRNPFVSEMEIKVKDRGVTIARAEYGYLVNDSGELEIEVEHGKFISIIPVDDEKFTKIFVDKISYLEELSKKAQKVFHIMISVLPHIAMGRDVIKLSYEDAQKYGLNMCRKTFNEAMKELISKEIIARTDMHGLYFINPRLFFAGNRLTFVDMYIKQSELSKLAKKIKEKIPDLKEFPIPEEVIPINRNKKTGELNDQKGRDTKN